MKEESFVVQCVILGDYCVLELWIRHLHSNAVGIPLHILGDSFLHLHLLAPSMSPLQYFIRLIYFHNLGLEKT